MGPIDEPAEEEQELEENEPENDSDDHLRLLGLRRRDEIRNVSAKTAVQVIDVNILRMVDVPPLVIEPCVACRRIHCIETDKGKNKFGKCEKNIQQSKEEKNKKKINGGDKKKERLPGNGKSPTAERSETLHIQIMVRHLEYSLFCIAL
ncbi:hypothetical protein C0J52_21060 [Blattella germanica]|nr:hypothetical protein C0J52_21060 [Blattella germanica]